MACSLWESIPTGVGLVENGSALRWSLGQNVGIFMEDVLDDTSSEEGISQEVLEAQKFYFFFFSILLSLCMLFFIVLTAYNIYYWWW
ncbi:MAG: hypothetical protein Q4D98_12105 [Planctomycetia bacterium]|nr:hypothetical protein [Planctomycetia bacterium]